MRVQPGAPKQTPVTPETPDQEARDVLLRECLRLRALGRTPDDIGMLLGMNPADVRLLVYGADDLEAV